MEGRRAWSVKDGEIWVGHFYFPDAASAAALIYARLQFARGEVADTRLICRATGDEYAIGPHTRAAEVEEWVKGIYGTARIVLEQFARADSVVVVPHRPQ